ncbi:hypothetical protein RSOLAG1IB_12375 [Rhizoctonia solani AG-1 IB]|uniref:Uncharacterized protein n=1 Tax=Thanatephorus cucumeris (strain AG1-IB / isolate 7/3/14) TaxID=1108050 RepID=A0A0B7FUG8_THACB|nr:hypothetical protein RSOLAG1IB_12375 [Rhizoctonia solani AG-1 IB]
MSYILGLPLMDLNCGAESMTLSLGFAFSGAIDQCHVQEACVKIARAWPILGSRLQRNSQTGKIEAVLPDPKEARLKVTFRASSAYIVSISPD